MQKEESGVSFNEVCYYASIPLSVGQILGGVVLVTSGPLGWSAVAGWFLVGSGVGGAYYTYNTEKSDFEFTKYCKKSLASGLASGVGGITVQMGYPNSMGIKVIARVALGGALGGAVGGVADSVLEGRGLPSGIQTAKYMAVGAFAGGLGQISNYAVLPILGPLANAANLETHALNRLFFIGLNAIVGGAAAGAIKAAGNHINGLPLAEGVVDSARFGAAIAGAIAGVITCTPKYVREIGWLATNRDWSYYFREFMELMRPQILSQLAQAESAQFRYEQDAYDKANIKYQKTFKEINDFLDECDEKAGFKLEKGKKITKDEAATAVIRGERIWCTKKRGKEEIVKCPFPHYAELQRAKADLEEAKQQVGVKIEEQPVLSMPKSRRHTKKQMQSIKKVFRSAQRFSLDVMRQLDIS